MIVSGNGRETTLIVRDKTVLSWPTNTIKKVADYLKLSPWNAFYFLSGNSRNAVRIPIPQRQLGAKLTIKKITKRSLIGKA